MVMDFHQYPLCHVLEQIRKKCLAPPDHKFMACRVPINFPIQLFFSNSSFIEGEKTYYVTDMFRTSSIQPGLKEARDVAFTFNTTLQIFYYKSSVLALC